MSELTIGDLRYIDESVNSWKMQIDMLLQAREPASEDVLKRIDELENLYKEDFSVFFRKAREEGTEKNAVEIQNAFDDEWEKKHPDFYDLEQLLKA